MADRPLEGSLVHLRALEPADEPLMFRWINDPEVTQWLLARYPFSHKQERDFIDAAIPGYDVARFAIESRNDGNLIGECSLRVSNPADRSAALGILIGDRSRWGRGYGTDAVRTLCRFGFAMMGLHRIELEVFEENERAIRLYERLGFRHEGIRRQAVFKFGCFHDIKHMGLLEGELSEAGGPT
jgi:RimJ/RimL family protein N-acetyltransferase